MRQEEGPGFGMQFMYAPVIEGGKIPDFLFPSDTAYNDPSFPAKRLRMLAAKTPARIAGGRL